ncbi:MATE family efflux transporter [Paracoccus pacificus]|uniref:MATE family efflux transporter n=1 Tax=Paracoccus pacificus TaxID=1463598 RepID=A0ABW4R3L7_9RHOB
MPTAPQPAPAGAADRPVTSGRVLRIALPIVLSNATVPILGLVDTGVIGQMGQAAPIGAVGIGAILLSTIYWIFGFLRMGTSGLVAQAKGAGDPAEGGAHLTRALTIAGLAGLIIILLQIPVFWMAFRLSPATPEVEALARQYLLIRVWGAPATIALYAVTGWLIAEERTVGVLLIQVLMNGLNVALDFWFVLGLGWGVQGVATASLIAEWSGLALGLCLARHAIALALRQRLADLFAAVKLRYFARVNGDILIRTALLQLCFLSFLFLGAGQGDVTLAANHVLLQLLSVTAYALDGFAFAAETLVGQAMGARRPDRLRRAAIVTSQWGAAGALLLAAVFWIGGPAFIDILTTSEPVRHAARDYLPWLVAAPVIGVASWMYDGIFIGAMLTREMRQAMILSTAIYALSLIVLLPLFGNSGLWAALMVLNIMRGVTLALLYPRAEARAATAATP